jgi:hypothetical protein
MGECSVNVQLESVTDCRSAFVLLSYGIGQIDLKTFYD